MYRSSLHRARVGQGRLQQPGQRRVGMQGLAAAAQNHRVARLDAEDGRVDGHIGPGLVNHGNDSEGDAHASHQQAVGLLPLLFRDAHGIGQLGHMQAGRAHLGHDGRGQGQAVQTRSIQARGAGRVQILAVGGQDFLFPRGQLVRQSDQGPRLDFGAGPAHGPGRFTGPRGQAFHFFRRRHGCSFAPP